MVEYSKTIPYRWLDQAPFLVRRQYYALQNELKSFSGTGLENLDQRLAIALEIRTIQMGYNPAYPFSCVTNFCELFNEPLHKDLNK
tara:strand:- start:29 stop:286 length:258 start_codon:yes stop_codon:yes gene_type:complete